MLGFFHEHIVSLRVVRKLGGGGLNCERLVPLVLGSNCMPSFTLRIGQKQLSQSRRRRPACLVQQSPRGSLGPHISKPVIRT